MIKIGTTVKIKTYDILTIVNEPHNLINESMKELSNTIAIIESVSPFTWNKKILYKIKGWWWTEEMFNVLPTVENKQYLLGF